MEIKSSQHCTSPACVLTLSHTAGWCGQPQGLRCTCPFCYAPSLPRKDRTMETRQTRHVAVSDLTAGMETIHGYRVIRDAVIGDEGVLVGVRYADGGEGTRQWHEPTMEVEVYVG